MEELALLGLVLPVLFSNLAFVLYCLDLRLPDIHFLSDKISFLFPFKALSVVLCKGFMMLIHYIAFIQIIDIGWILHYVLLLRRLRWLSTLAIVVSNLSNLFTHLDF